MQPASNYDRFIRYGLLIIGIGGLIFAAGDALIPQEGNMFNATEDPEAFANLVTGENFQLWALRGLIGVPMEVIGTIALFFGLMGTEYEKWGFWGMMLCVLSDLFGTGLFTLLNFIFPGVGELILAGTESATPLASLDAFMPVMGVTFVATGIGLGLFAVAIWKTDIFPRWSGILVLVGWLLILFPGYFVQIAANLIWGGAYLWMATYSWNRFSGAGSARATT